MSSGLYLSLNKEGGVFIFFAYQGFSDIGCLEVTTSCLVSSDLDNILRIFLDYLGCRVPKGGVSNSMIPSYA